MSFARSRGAAIALIVAAVIALVLIGVGVYGLLRGPAVAQPEEHQTPVATGPVQTNERVASPKPLATTADPERFARIITHALLEWDTRAEGGAASWAQPLIDASDADEANGVAADVRAYIPSGTLWDELRTYGTRQTLTIETVEVPDSWIAARSQAAGRQLPASASAFTISGIAERTGVWNGKPVESSRPVSFTVFIDCPSEHPCHLLRLSRPDAPLK
ncbi:hypothetical protein [Agromyces sp. Marseille-Q5079]|uniref:hypothetical protein n=1 Tax=Agromyces sp. Marseille-Q5079 TaxID=3439059 RepID=UPI003D9C9C6B